jgi:hypothetical protein
MVSYLRWCVVVGLLVAAGGACSGPTGDSGACFPDGPVATGGSAAQRQIVTQVLCGMTATKAPLPTVAIRASPHIAPHSFSLRFTYSMPAAPPSPASPNAAAWSYSSGQAAWQAAVIAGAVRDRSQRRHLPHIAEYDLYFTARDGKGVLQGQGRIALPGWGDPEGQGSGPPPTLGHGVLPDDRLQARLESIAEQTHTHVTVRVGHPLGEAPLVTVTAPSPQTLLAGPIQEYLTALGFRQMRYDGVILAVFDAKGHPVWLAGTADRIRTRQCAVLSAEAGTTHGSLPSFTGAGERACAAVGLGFS